MWSSCHEGEVTRCEGITLLNGEVMKEVEKEGCMHLGIVEVDQITESVMKEKDRYGIYAKAPKGAKIKTEWEKQNNINKYMGSDSYSGPEQKYHTGKRVN